jgi:S-adenosylmethionine decarboxylase
LEALPLGTEWLVDAHGCDAAALRSVETLERVFGRVVAELRLNAAGAPSFHVFPEPGGITGLLLLTESHLACHTFPERGFAAFNLYCCRPREEWPWPERLREALQATRVTVRRVERGQP